MRFTIWLLQIVRPKRGTRHNASDAIPLFALHYMYCANRVYTQVSGVSRGETPPFSPYTLCPSITMNRGFASTRQEVQPASRNRVSASSGV